MLANRRYEEYEALAYNSQLKPISQPEFGRNVQRMIEKAIAEPDRTIRNRMAKAIIEIMAQLTPQLKDVADYKHKLWDNLFIISEFRLDVDSPYSKPNPETLDSKPEKVNYPHTSLKFRHYGKTIENLVNKARKMPDSEERAVFVEMIANMMKRSYLAWNRDTVTDDIILEQLGQMSGGELKLDPNKRLLFIDFRLKKQEMQNFNKKGKKKKRRQINSYQLSNLESTTKRKLLDKLKFRYRVVVINDETFKEQATFTLSLLNLLVFIGSVTLFFILLLIYIIAFTSLREYIPGYADVNLRRNISKVAMRSDSLMKASAERDLYLKNIENIINDEVTKSDLNTQVKNGEIAIDSSKLSPSKSELVFRNEVIISKEQFICNYHHIFVYFY